MKSTSMDSASAAPALQPETRTLQTAASVAMASAATRDSTKTGRAAGWSARSTKGRRAMILGAASNSSALHQAPALATGKRRHQAEIALGFRHRRDHAGGAHMRHEGHREAEMEARGIAHQGVARREIGMHRERRLHIGEGGDDDAPDALDGIERQDAFVALDQPPHHLGLARRAEGRAAVSWLFLTAISRSMISPRSIRRPVHGLVEAVDFLAQVGQRGRFSVGSGHGGIDRWAWARNQENVDSSTAG